MLPKRPYPGLRPFAVDEWEIFFGREIMTEEVIQRLLRNSLVLVHGSSGSGKSFAHQFDTKPRRRVAPSSDNGTVRPSARTGPRPNYIATLRPSTYPTSFRRWLNGRPPTPPMRARLNSGTHHGRCSMQLLR